MDASVDVGGFVGRGDELARLDATMAAARSGAAQTIIVAGEAGIGKTRLVERWSASARADGWNVLEGACLPPGGGALPYAPFVEALRALTRAVEPARWPALLGPGRAELARILPEVAPSGAGALEAAVGPPEMVEVVEVDRGGQARLFEAVLGVVERSARAAPTAIVIDDLQWADDGSRDLLGFLIRGARASPVMFAVTVRTDDIDRRDPVAVLLAELERDAQVERVDLRAFDRDELAALLRPELGDEPPRDRLDRILDRSAGNPFFAEQLAAVGEGAETDVPPGLRDVLLARLARLTDATQTVVRVAAAAGRSFDDDLLAAVTGWSASEIAEAVRAAIHAGIVIRSGDAYVFRHAVVRDVAYAELITGERARLHRQFAVELSRRREIDATRVSNADLAYHWDAAGDDGRAAAAHLAAGLDAEHVYAFAEASRQFERTIAAWDGASAAGRDPGADAGLDLVAVMRHAAEAAVRCGAPAQAVDLGRAAISTLEGSADADPARLGELHERLRWYLWEAGDQVGAARAVAEAVRLIPADPPTRARARALAQSAGLRLLAGDVAAAGLMAEEALAVAREVEGQGEAALALGILGWVQASMGDVDLGIETFREGLTIAERLGGVEGIALGYANLAALLDRVGRTDASLAAARDGYATVRDLGMVRTYGGILLGHAAKALFDQGRLDDAAATADEGLDLDPVGRPAVWLHVNRARIDTNRGRFDDAAAHLRRAEVLDAGIGGAELYRPALLAASAELGMWRGRIDDVRTAVASGLASVRDDRPLDPALGWLAWHAIRAEADRATDARSRQDVPGLAEARRHVGPIGDWLTRFDEVGTSPLDSRRPAIVASCRAELDRLEGRRDPATWERVVAGWSALGRPVPTAYATYRRAEAILGAHGPRDDAVAALSTAAEVARSLGLAPLLGEIERLARHARVHLPAVDADGTEPTDDGDGVDAAYGLTQRETEVLALVAAGWSNQQIADALFITRKTASVHVSNILGKFGVRNRVEAAAVAHRLGLDEAGPPPSDDPARG